MLRDRCRSALVALTIAAVAACGTPTPDPTASASGPGWRKGVVLRVGHGPDLGPPTDSDCRAPTEADTDDERRYVEVRYYVGRHAHLRILPIDDALPVAAGDAIYFRTAGCSEARPVGTGR